MEMRRKRILKCGERNSGGCFRNESVMSTTQRVGSGTRYGVNTMRTLAIDRDQQANSGHPGRRWHVPTVYCLCRFLEVRPEILFG